MSILFFYSSPKNRSPITCFGNNGHEMATFFYSWENIYFLVTLAWVIDKINTCDYRDVEYRMSE